MTGEVSLSVAFRPRAAESTEIKPFDSVLRLFFYFYENQWKTRINFSRAAWRNRIVSTSPKRVFEREKKNSSRQDEYLSCTSLNSNLKSDEH